MSPSTYIQYVYAYISIGGFYKIYKANIPKKINTKVTFCLHNLLIQLVLNQTQLLIFRYIGSKTTQS